MNSLFKYCFLLFVLMVSVESFAAGNGNASQCSSPDVTTSTASGNLGDNGLIIGRTFSLLDVTRGSQKNLTCNCPDRTSGSVYYTTESDLPYNGNGTYSYNEYLDVRISIYPTGSGNAYDTPWAGRVYGSVTGCTATAGTLLQTNVGSAYSVIFIVKKPIDAPIQVVGTLLRVYATINNAPYDSMYPATVLNANLTLSSSANCRFQAGDVISVDMGSIQRAQLVEGDVPQGFMPKAVDLSVSCTGVTPVALVYSFDGQRSGNFITSTLPGVGIGLLDENSAPISLGASNPIVVPYVAGAANFSPSIYPTKIPGVAVENGNYKASVIVSVSLP